MVDVGLLFKQELTPPLVDTREPVCDYTQNRVVFTSLLFFSPRSLESFDASRRVTKQTSVTLSFID